jgi:predicted kinase
MGYFNLAAGYAVPPSLILLCGLPGTGKSHAAGVLARVLESTVCNSDVARKRQAALPPTARAEVAYQTGLYDAEHTAQTYRALLDDTRAALGKGRSVLVDAGFRQAALRAPFAAMAHELAVPVAILHLDPPEAVVVQRLLDRQASGRGESDAGVAVYAECKRDFEPPHRGEGAKVIHSDAADLGPEFVARVLAALLAQAEPPATAHASD